MSESCTDASGLSKGVWGRKSYLNKWFVAKCIEQHEEDHVHFIASPGIIGHVLSPGIRQSDLLLNDRVRPNAKLIAA